MTLPRTDSAPTIRRLSPSVVNKIAAGEVIERPASALKELLENALDAGATRIDVAIGQGGSELLRVTDNGCGIEADELPLAIASHATSKISDADDLFHVRTLGFRGEALASMAEVSHLVIRSRTAAAHEGAELEVVGGEARPVAPCGCASGTTVEVRRLFFNTPVRRKFLRTTQTEMGHLAEAFSRVALSHPQVHMTLRHNDRVLHDLPPTETWTERIAALFGADVSEALIGVSGSDGPTRLVGWVGHPQASRPNNRMQYLFLNGRYVRDRSLAHALGEAYRGLLISGRYPIAFLRLDMPPDAVDVNVHPTKLEVRFHDSGRVYSLMLGTLRKKFLASDLTSYIGPSAPGEGAESSGLDQAQAEAHRRQLVAWAKGQVDSDSEAGGSAGSTPGELDLRFDDAQGTPIQLTRLGRPTLPAESGALRGRPEAVGLSGAQHRASAEPPLHGPTDRSRAEEQSPDAFEDSSASPDDRGAPTRRGLSAIQVHNRYLVAEGEEGVLVIDQHALHERILYEQLREKVLSGAIETQRLLVPEPVHMTAAECAAALEAREALAALGIAVEPFGGDTVLVSNYPAILANFSPTEVLQQVTEHLLHGGRTPELRDLVDELLHMVACKAAIKAGDRLSHDEIAALLSQRHLCQDAHHCPHGRPTALIFTREELDRRFMRK